MSGKIKNLDEKDFDAFIKKGNAVIDFYADWCGPCKVMVPDLEKASQDLKDVNFGKVNVDGNQDLAGRYGVMSIPTLIFFKDGDVVEATRCEAIEVISKGEHLVIHAHVPVATVGSV